MRFDALSKLLCRPDKLLAFRDSIGLFPFSLEMDVTDECNLNCSFCFWKDSRNNIHEEMDGQKGMEILQKLYDYGVESIIWSGGGEPLSHHSFNSLLKRSADLGMRNGLFTNGLLVNVEMDGKNILNCCDWIRFNPVEYLGESADGIAFEYNDEFLRILLGLIDIRKRHLISCDLGIGWVAMVDNYRLLPDAILSAAEAGMDFFQIKHDNLNICNRKYREFWDEKIVHMAENMRRKYAREITVDYSNKNYLPPYSFKKCFMGYFSAIVRPDGNLIGCKIHRFSDRIVFGNILSDTKDELLEKRDAVLTSFNVEENCQFCPYKDLNTILNAVKFGGDSNMYFL